MHVLHVAGDLASLHESVLKRVHVAARVRQPLHDSLRSRGQFQNASILAFVSPRFCLQSLSFAILRRSPLTSPPSSPPTSFCASVDNYDGAVKAATVVIRTNCRTQVGAREKIERIRTLAQICDADHRPDHIAMAARYRSLVEEWEKERKAQPVESSGESKAIRF